MAVAAATIAVTRFDDPAAGMCTPADCSLRQAIAAAQDGDAIVAPAGDYRLAEGDLVVDTDVTVAGAGGRAVIHAAPFHRVMRIEGGTVALRGLELTGGQQHDRG
jgi:hypothetical protein